MVQLVLMVHWFSLLLVLMVLATCLATGCYRHVCSVRSDSSDGSTGSVGSAVTASDGSTDCSTHYVGSEVSTCSYGSTLFLSVSSTSSTSSVGSEDSENTSTILESEESSKSNNLQNQ